MAQETEGESKEWRMSRTEMSAVLNKYGWYQRRLMLLIILPLTVSGFKSMSVVITFVSPDHRCRVPGLSNDTFSIHNEAHRMLVNLSIPMTSVDGDVSYSKCEVYKDRDEGHANRTLYDDTEACDSWVYDDSDFERTIVTEFDLVCEDRGFRANFNMIYMLGLLAGSAVSGILCDRFGRKRMFMVGLMLTIAISTATAFPVVVPMLLVYRFLSSFFGSFLYLGLYVLCLEFMGPPDRTLAGSLMMLFWVLGPLMVGGLSYFLTDWRWLQISTAPFVFLLGYGWILDESPRWLMTKGREKEAQKVILKVMKVNKIPLPVDGSLDAEAIQMGNLKQNDKAATENTDKQNSQTENKTTDGKEKNNEHEADKVRNGEAEKQQSDNAERQNTVVKEEEEREIPQESILKLFKYPNLIGRTGIIFLNWSAVSTTYYGLSLNVANLGGSVRLSFLLSSLVEIPGYMMAWFLLDRLGRQRTHCGFMFLAGLSCLSTIFSVMYGGPDLHWVTVLLVMVGKLGISAAFSTVYLMSGELFPTVIRNMGMGSSSMVARVATALSPYISDLSLYIEGNLGRALPLVIFGALALLAGLLALCLPETLHRKLPDTILEAANFTKSMSDDIVHVPKTRTDTKHNP